MEDIPLEAPPRSNEDPEDDREIQVSRHAYFKESFGQAFLKVVDRWRNHPKGFKVAATLDPDRLQSTVKTVYQRLYHGRKWCLLNLADENTLNVVRSIKISQHRDCVKLTYVDSGYLAKTMEDAMSFGEERIDAQALFMDWMESNPPDGAKWPEDELVFSDEDIKWFTETRKRLMSLATPRFVVDIKGGNRVTVTSIIV